MDGGSLTLMAEFRSLLTSASIFCLEAWIPADGIMHPRAEVSLCLRTLHLEGLVV